MSTITPSEAREFLTGFDHCSHPLAMEYLNVALDRLLVTLDLMPRLEAGARILELGAMPYFMTCLLLRHYPSCRLELANEPDRLKLDGGHVRLVNRRHHLDFSFTYEAFNIETDPFPYEDGSLDVVLYCEMIEHLMHDPTHSLYEIHRILKPGGYLLLSTPNPFRYTNYLRFLTGKNIYPPFSGWGPYARHNREFSTRELRLLLKQCNFEIETLITAYDPAYDHPKRLDGVARWLHKRGLLREQMDVIHLRAKAVGKPIYRYPPELYLDVHAYQRIVNDNIEMGVNDEAQLGAGFQKLESWPPFVRWTDKAAVARLRAGSHTSLGIRFYSGPKELSRRVTGKLSLNGVDHTLDVAPGEWVELRLPLSAPPHDVVEMSLELDRTWVPSEVLGIPDTREIGIAVQRIWLE
ncbi:MAG: class I SAM-dependent methyltransferase [Sphingomonadaceae bacterium]